MVDSSWYIQTSRDGRDPLIELALAAETRDIAVCGLIIAEVGRGLRHQRYLDRYRQAWYHMLYVPSHRERWEETLKIVWHLDRKGQILPIQDIHIAACALHIGAAILTFDGHFNKIPGLATVREPI
jgi:predicted nucleic acid-binding protein